MTKHLVLGSEGQIGKYVCAEIESRGDQLVRWDIELNPTHDLTGIMDTGELEYQASLADFVHFLAFNVGGSKYLAQHQNSFEYLQSNLDLMNNTFGVLRKTKTPFYFASSQMSNMTDSVYGQLKMLGESYTRALGGVSVKFWNVFGYESDPEKSHVITDFIKMAFEENRIVARTSGQERRHFTYAKDAARMLYEISQNYEDALLYVGRDRILNRELDGTIHIVNPRQQWMQIAYVGEAVIRAVRDYKGLKDWQYYDIFVSRTEDKTQTVRNEYEFPQRLFPFSNEFTRLEHGIAEMVELIGKDYA